ncbi:MAG: heme lyase CcmF/NrfE family subunit, partial [Acidobacteriota bacterium]|nr:heme lyase CcmF/NrfE family subunit [Acidobacteriota bacterium]
MTSALGQGFVLLGLIAAGFGAAFGYIAGVRRSAAGLRLTRRLALLFAVAMVGACAVMWYALLSHDFSVSYVAQVGSMATPLHITIFSLWSSLEGSILFWGLILGLYIAAAAVFQRRGHEDYLAYTLATLLGIGAFFTFLIASVADPLAPTAPPVPVDGPGPNPLL